MSPLLLIVVGGLLGLALVGVLIASRRRRRLSTPHQVDWQSLAPHEVPLPPHLSPAPIVPQLHMAPDSPEPVEPAAAGYAASR